MKISTALEKLDKGLSGPGVHNTPFERRQIFEDTCIAGRITMLDTVNGCGCVLRPLRLMHESSSISLKCSFDLALSRQRGRGFGPGVSRKPG